MTKTIATPPGEIGFADVRFHSFRHYFCSQCFLGGASEAKIRECMRRLGSKIVELYRHLRREDAARKMGKITFMNEAGDAVSEGVA